MFPILSMLSYILQQLKLETSQLIFKANQLTGFYMMTIVAEY